MALGGNNANLHPQKQVPRGGGTGRTKEPNADPSRSSGLPGESWSLRPGSRGPSRALVSVHQEAGGRVMELRVGCFSTASHLIWEVDAVGIIPILQGKMEEQRGRVAHPGSHGQEEAGPGCRVSAAAGESL